MNNKVYITYRPAGFHNDLISFQPDSPHLLRGGVQCSTYGRGNHLGRQSSLPLYSFPHGILWVMAEMPAAHIKHVVKSEKEHTHFKKLLMMSKLFNEPNNEKYRQGEISVEFINLCRHHLFLTNNDMLIIVCVLF